MEGQGSQPSIRVVLHDYWKWQSFPQGTTFRGIPDLIIQLNSLSSSERQAKPLGLMQGFNGKVVESGRELRKRFSSSVWGR